MRMFTSVFVHGSKSQTTEVQVQKLCMFYAKSDHVERYGS